MGHICPSWRSVFVSSPCFWDRFSFETHSMEEISLLQRTLALVELCIERTKDRPFSFDFRVSRIYDDIVPSPLLLETLVAHADRWRAACLIIDINQLKPLTTSDSTRTYYRLSLSLGENTNSPSCALYRSMSMTITARKSSHLPSLI